MFTFAGICTFVGFSSIGSKSGINIINANGSLQGHILIEDCWFSWFGNNIIFDLYDSSLNDLIIRRNIFSNNYTVGAHSQGLYATNASVLLEENIFDHNGWYQQSTSGGGDSENGQATYYNHSTYFVNMRNTIFRKNLFLRSPSIGNKFTSNPTGDTDEIFAWNILIDNNLYVEGEAGIGIGGNTDNDDGPRWKNIYITNNVMLDIGSSQPTGRSLAWALEIDDWDSGYVAGNIFAHFGSSTILNVHSLEVCGYTSDTKICSGLIAPDT